MKGEGGTSCDGAGCILPSLGVHALDDDGLCIRAGWARLMGQAVAALWIFGPRIGPMGQARGLPLRVFGLEGRKANYAYSL
ncbi:hypothetical protein AAHA92_32883 [Salvia divinorum]|uniref:Uncharacterized protein n=1 Tax=Salvia divinorum TaxID=28513 RepID=A0ABD1FQA5_SALDI